MKECVLEISMLFAPVVAIIVYYYRQINNKKNRF